jgi:hypothetical protein
MISLRRVKDIKIPAATNLSGQKCLMSQRIDQGYIKVKLTREKNVLCRMNCKGQDGDISH